MFPGYKKYFPEGEVLPYVHNKIRFVQKFLTLMAGRIIRLNSNLSENKTKNSVGMFRIVNDRLINHVFLRFLPTMSLGNHSREFLKQTH